MAKDRREKKPKGGKVKVTRCTLCKPNHDHPSDDMARHQAEVRRLEGRRHDSRAYSIDSKHSS